MLGAPLTDGKRPRECALFGTLYIWECVRSTGKEMISRETSVEQVSFSNVLPSLCYAKRVGKSRSQEAGNSSSREVEEVEQSPGSRDTGSQVSTVLVLVV